jgi:hypothetical protein
MRNKEDLEEKTVKANPSLGVIERGGKTQIVGQLR